MPSQTRELPHNSDLSKSILNECMVRVRMSERRLQQKHTEWFDAEERVLAYLPERDVDAIRRADREGGMPQYTTIQIPYTYAVLMAAHTYLTSVFMGRNPTFQYSGRHGEGEQQVQAIEALIDYQTVVGYQLPPLYTWLYDAGKYGVGIIGLYWEDKIEHVTSIVNEPILDIMGQPSGKFNKKQSTQPIKTYSGNRLYNIQPWDFLWDTRLPVREFQRGEYVAVRRSLGWNEVVRRKAQGFYYNTENLPKQSTKQNSFGSQGSDQLMRPEMMDFSTTGDEGGATPRDHPMVVNLYEVYIEIIPKEFKLSGSDYPEKWVFTCSHDFSCLIGCQPLGAYHCKFPMNVLALEPEAYGLVPRGMPETLKPIQQTVDWLINSHFYNVRAVLNNKTIVDPSRVVMKDVLNPLPGGVIRLKPEAYGSDVKLAMQQLAVTDVTQNHLRDLQMMYGMGERTVGVNDQIMGMLQSGGRKTATEVRTSTSFGVNRLKTIAEYFSVTGFDPLSMMQVQNSQQYYDGEQKFRVAGDLVQSAGPQFLVITPDLIAGFYNFVPVDGTLPIDRYAQANLWQNLMGQMQKFPEIMLQYDVGRIFEWVAKLAGLKNISQFKSQIQPDAMLLQQAKLGNVVPLGGGGGGRRPAAGPPPGNRSNPNEPGQVPGMGPTG